MLLCCDPYSSASPEFLLLALNFSLQSHEGIQDILGTGRTAGHVYINRDNMVDTRDGGVIVVKPTG